MNFLKNLFKTPPQKSGIVFIVEDNALYASTLKNFINTNFPQVKEIIVFPVGETCLTNLHKNPDLIIIDYFLDSKYYDAETGLQTIEKIRSEKPQLNIIVLSSQQDIDVVIEAVKKYNCSYVKKDNDAFARVAELAKDII